MIDRRTAVIVVLACSRVLRAQQPARMARVGILNLGSPQTTGHLVDAVTVRLHELGYVEGSNIILDLRWAMGDPDRLPALARELLALNPDVLWTGSTLSALVAQQASATVPIVGAGLADPVGSGLAKTLARPGGNVTGVSSLAGDFGPKLLELLLSVMPRLDRVAILWTDSNPRGWLMNLIHAARTSRVNVLALEIRTASQFDGAFARMAAERVNALIVPGSALVYVHRQRVADLANSQRLLWVSDRSEFTGLGALMSYGPNLIASFRQSVAYVDKILRGAKPGDLPIEQATLFELVLNAKTAKSLGLTIPQSLLIRADEVIE